MTQQKILSSQLADSGVVPGTYTAADITIDAAGRVTAAANGGTGGTVTSIGVSGNNGVSVSGSPITSSGTITLGLDAITPDSVAAVGTVTGSNLSGTNTGDQTITLTGDVTGSGTGSFAATLSNTGVAAGAYTTANVTVDAKGRITSISNGSSGSSLPLNEIGFGDGTGITSSSAFTYFSGLNSLYVNVPTVQNESAEVIIRSGDNLGGFGHSEILLSTAPSDAASDIYIQAGNDIGTGAGGGNITIGCGDSTLATGGQFNLNGGNGIDGGDVSIIAGAGSMGIGGLLFLGGGNTASATDNAGDVLIRGGNNTSDPLLSGRVVIRTDNQNRLIFGQAGDWLINGTDPGNFGQILTSQGAGFAPAWFNADNYTFDITNGIGGEGNQTFTVQNSDTVTFNNLEVDQTQFSVSVIPINFVSTYNGTVIQTFPNADASIVNHPMQLVVGTGLTATITGTWNESLLLEASGGSSTPGIDTQILLSDGLGGFSLAEAYFTATPAQDAILTLGTNGSENTSTGSIITTFQQGGGNGRDGTDLTVAASNAFFPFDSLVKNGGSLFLSAGRGGENTGVDRTGVGGNVTITAGNSRDDNGGTVYIVSGINETMTLGIDGGVEVHSGQLGYGGGHFSVNTGEIERLRIGSQGSWKVNGNNGTYGQVLMTQGPSSPPVWTSFTWNEITADYTLGQADLNNGVAANSASPILVIIPEDGTYNFPDGTSILVTADNTGTVTIDFEVGVTVNIRSPLTLVLSGQYAIVTLVKRGPNLWYAGGDFA